MEDIKIYYTKDILYKKLNLHILTLMDIIKPSLWSNNGKFGKFN